jgi:hypothetical protein
MILIGWGTGVAVGGGVTEGVWLMLGVNELVAGGVTGVGGGPSVDTGVALVPQAEINNAVLINKSRKTFFIIHSFEYRKQKETVYYCLLSVF